MSIHTRIDGMTFAGRMYPLRIFYIDERAHRLFMPNGYNAVSVSPSSSNGYLKKSSSISREKKTRKGSTSSTVLVIARVPILVSGPRL